MGPTAMLRVTHSLKRAAACSLVLFVAIQFVPVSARKAQTAAPLHIPSTAMPASVAAVVDRSCRDCHSQSTVWPWYSRIAPMSWLVARDVSRGRAKLNFAGWNVHSPSANERMDLCDAVSNDSMPLRAYRWMHRNAALSQNDVKLLCDWADGNVASSTPAATGSGNETRARSTKDPLNKKGTELP